MYFRLYDSSNRNRKTSASGAAGSEDCVENNKFLSGFGVPPTHCVSIRHMILELFRSFGRLLSMK